MEDAWNRQRERALRSRGWRNRVIAHTSYGSLRSARIFARVLMYQPGDPDELAAERDELTYGGLRSAYLTRRGWRAFVTAPAMDVPVSVKIGSRWAYGRSDRSGNVDLTVDGHNLTPGWHEVQVMARSGEPVSAPIFIVGDDVRVGLISDIDDTVLTTSLPRPLIAAWNTFVLHEKARRVVAGMAPFYRELLEANPGAPCVYVSTGAWNTAPALTRFLKTGGYPAGPLLLTDWGPTNTGWFRSGQDHKRASLARLALDFPDIRWCLVGDDGQHDPALYTEFAAARPELVEAIAIRQLTAAEQVLSHGIPVSNEELAGGPQARAARPQARGAWPQAGGARPQTPVFYAPDGYGLARLFRTAGLLPSKDSDLG